MAIRVTPMRGMNGLSQKNFEDATRYKIEETKNGGLVLHLYEGSTRLATYYPGCWETVEVYTPLDRKAKVGKTKKQSHVTVKQGAEIRTSPKRGEGGKRRVR